VEAHHEKKQPTKTNQKQKKHTKRATAFALQKKRNHKQARRSGQLVWICAKWQANEAFIRKKWLQICFCNFSSHIIPTKTTHWPCPQAV